ncbi:MAG: hypothetical protein HKN44_13400 [Ilumatobacter sp.]|nr:hypothetical protein [Ilumatobacter sp.]
MATTELQGTAEGDYCWTVEGELVTPVVAECCTPDSCGCAAGFPGLASSRATTTAKVVDLAHLTERDVRDVIEGALERDGWFDLIDPADADELVDEHVECIAAVCASFPVGAVIGRRGTAVFRRSIAQAA